MGSTRDRIEGKKDDAKGKIKEAAGRATNKEDLEREGRKDQLKGELKGAMGKAKEAAHDAKEGIKEAADRKR